ncbi:MAG: ester cyclase [Candidatus Competibacteraceae bacterium]
MSEANKAIIRRFYEEVMGQGNVNLLDEIMTPNFADHGETLFGSPQDRDTLKQGITASRTVLGDLHVQLHDIIADGAMVGVRGTMRCTHQGTFLGTAPSGNELTWNGLAMFRVVDGRITERWFNSDSLSIVQQLGLVPPLGS